MSAEDVAVSGPLPLGAFLKVCGAAGTGGEAKVLVQSGMVHVNGVVETRRGHAVGPGDEVVVDDRHFRIVAGACT
jgi:ribosome-associated protein